jgi:hypothetical protein
MKAQLKTGLCFAAMCFALGLSTPDARAFSLLGPFEPWMTATNGFYPSNAGDIGGPMCISNGYRWNVPVVTYGFDQSFLDYFGTNGVAAVENAIQILNNLPPASGIALTNFPFETRYENYEAQSYSLIDLKSETLSLLLEHMGLTQPSRYVYILRQWNSILADPSNQNLLLSVFEGTNLSNYVVTRNYDPQMLNASPYVNEALYTGYVLTSPNQSYAEVVSVDPLADSYTAVADNNLGAGAVYQGLTRDDVGGLAYLLSTNNVNYETLLSGIYGVGVNSNSFVNGAWRPGVDKITFIPQPVDLQSGAFLPTTNYFTDSYITNGVLQQQQMARVISQPDFLFSVGDVTDGRPEVPFYSRTGTTNWLNNATANGNINGAGPGVIQPQVQIMFNKLGPLLQSDGSISDEQVLGYSLQYWGSFDDSTNAPVVYPMPQTGTNQMTVRMWLLFGNNFQESFGWKPSSLPGAPFAFQTSTNLNNWVTIFAVTNNGSVSTYLNSNPSSTSRFYRLVPQ